MNMKAVFVYITVAVCAVGAAAADQAVLTPEEHEEFSVLRDIGLQRDGSQPEKVAAGLRHRNWLVQMEALLAAARLGDAKALPAVQELQGADRPEVAAYARVVAAEIRAVRAGAARDAQALRRQMEQVITNVGMTPALIRDQVVGAGSEQELSEKVTYWVLRQVADMALMAARREVPGAAAAAPVDLGLHPVTRLKAQLAALPQVGRVAALVDVLTAIKAVRLEEEFVIQALINEGAPARTAILERLRALAGEPEKLTNPASGALFRALEGLGGDEAAEVVALFLKHPDRYVRHHAMQSHEVLKARYRRNRMFAY